MVYVMRTVSAATPIETPAIVNGTDAKRFSVRSAISFRVGDLLTGVLSNFPSRSKGFGCEAAFAVNSRSFDG